jgi:uncharacterized protein involved in exopolysaccharide biosynthesis
MEVSLDPRNLWRITWRRKWFFLTPATLVLATALALAVFLPPIYRSQAVILIEGQDIPEDLVPSLVTDYIDRRLETMTRQILRTENLVRMIERYELYPEERDVLMSSALADLMRQDVTTNIISTTVNDPRFGRRSEVAIAFEIAFEHTNADKARRVADEIVSLYLSTNLEQRREVASQTTEFFASEGEAVERRIDRIENELAEFKATNLEYLPEEINFARRQLANVEQQLQLLDRDLRTLREREAYLTAERALTNEFDTRGDRGAATTPEGQLEIARAELATARARYAPSHPDVLRLQNEVRSLESVVGERAGVGRLIEQENRLVAELASLRERYTPEHPDVQRVQRQLRAIRSSLAEGSENGRVSDAAQRNPAFVQLSAQLNSVQTERQSIEQQREEVLSERERLQGLLARAPVVEREYTRLQRALENAIADREALADKEATVQLSGALESEAISEQLVLAEPASLPNAPARPNQKLILALGLLLAVGSGTASVAASEALDRSVRGKDNLMKLIGDPPLVAIPTLMSPTDRRRRLGIRMAAFGGLVAVSLGGAAWVNTHVAPLTVLGFQARHVVDQWLVRTFPNLQSSEHAD